MGKTQSKRSVDITTEGGKTKGAEDEVAVTGKLEKIEDVDQQQKQLNGDAANQSESNDAEKKDVDEAENDKDLTTEKSASGDAGNVQNGAEVNENGDQSKTSTATASAEASSDEMKTKETETAAAAAAAEDISPLADESMKKSKKEKVKKKWSFRSISFGKKDKQKPTKTEESNGETNVEKQAADAASPTADTPKADDESVPSNNVEHQNGDASENVEEKKVNTEDTPSSTDEKSTEGVADTDVTTQASVDVATEENVVTSTAEVIVETANAIATEKTNGVTTEENGLDAHCVSDVSDVNAVDTEKAVTATDVVVDSKNDKIDDIANTTTTTTTINGHQNGTDVDGDSETTTNVMPEVEANTESKTVTEQSKSQIEVINNSDNTPDTQLAPSHTIANYTTANTTTTTTTTTTFTATDVACVVTPQEPNVQSESSNDLKTAITTENYTQSNSNQEDNIDPVKIEISACEATDTMVDVIETFTQLTTNDTTADHDNHFNDNNDDNQKTVSNSDTIAPLKEAKNLQNVGEVVNVGATESSEISETADDNHDEKSTFNSNKNDEDNVEEHVLQHKEIIQSDEIEMERIQSFDKDAAMMPPPLPASPPPSQMFVFAFNGDDNSSASTQSAANVNVESVDANDKCKAMLESKIERDEDLIAKEILLTANALVDNTSEKAIEIIEQRQEANDLLSLDKEINIQADNQAVDNVTKNVTIEEGNNNDDTNNVDDDTNTNTNTATTTTTTGDEQEEQRCNNISSNGDLSMESEKIMVELPSQQLAAAVTTDVDDVPFETLNSCGDDEPSQDSDGNTKQHQHENSLSPSPTKDIASAQDLKETAAGAEQNQTTTQQDIPVTCE